MATILPRTAWTTANNGRAGRSLSPSRVTGITLHWPTGGNMLGLSKDQIAAKLRGWRAAHMAKTWADIGYNYAVDGSGRIWNLTGNNVGAHAGGNGSGNTNSVGVLLVIGQSETPNAAMIQGVKELHTELRKSLTKATKVYGHRDWVGTECPGAAVYAAIKAGTFSGTPTPEQPIVWTDREDEYRVDITLPVYGRIAPHVDATKVTGALAVGSIIYATAITTQADGDWVRSQYGTCFKVSSLTLIGDEPAPEQPDPEPGATQYTVLPGDTLTSIAARYGLTLAQLLALNGLDIIAPGLVLSVTDDTDPEPEPVPEPTPTVQRWFKIASGNFAMYNDRGESTYTSRRDDWIAEVKDIDPDVLCIQEAGFDTLPWLDAAIYEAVGLERVEGGSDGRYIYADPSFEVLGSGVFDLQPRYKGDDKQAAWEALNIGGHFALITSFHLENEDPSNSNVRVGQMQSCITQGAAQAKRHSVPAENIVHCGDTNSDSWVTEKAAIPAGFVDVFTVAKEVGDDDMKSFNGWAPTKEGPRIDSIYTAKGHPVLAAGQRLNHKASDHNLQAAVIGI